jgi:radical SAM superfamily enzyme YgiQ (UPF0313 family)
MSMRTLTGDLHIYYRATRTRAAATRRKPAPWEIAGCWNSLKRKECAVNLRKVIPKMSKILLIKPRFLSLEFRTITQPLGLMYIGAALKKYGHNIKIHDCALDYNDLNILRRTLQDWQPDFIGISIIITEVEQTKKVMAILREMLPDVPVIFGGPWPSANPEESIRRLGANFVVLGEGEQVFSELIEAINKGLPVNSISGIASMMNGNIKINPIRFLSEGELNALPFPAWELIDHKLYARTTSMAGMGRRMHMTIVTSRGCPFKCAYCHQTMGKVFRKRSAESVISEMAELRFKYGFKEFEIVDDCFNLDRQRMHAILAGIRDRIGDIRLHFPNGIRADLIEPQDMTSFKQAGTVSVVFAIETVSPRLQKMIHKNLNIEKTSRAIHTAVREGIFTSGFFMIGFPSETYKEASDTVNFAVCSPLHKASFFIPTPFAGTELAKMVSRTQSKKKKDINLHEAHYYNSTRNISAMSDRELREIFRNAYLRFYLNPKRIIKYVINHPQPSSFPRAVIRFLVKVIPRKFIIR